jgi:hypothetical protein
MRTITTLSILIFSYSGLIGQDCLCKNDSLLADMISCDTIFFDRGVKLYWNYNCDSSWLTYKNSQGKKTIMFSLGGGLVNLTGRLGYVDFIEYKDVFLVQNNVISGCCTPADFYVYDKFSGELKYEVGRLIFYSTDIKKPFLIGFAGNDEDSLSGVYDFLTIYNLDNNKKYRIDLIKGEIDKALEETEQIYPEYLFQKPIIDDDTITLIYYLRKPTNTSNKPTKTITINLKKYSS